MTDVPSPPPIRRVITGHDSNGVAKVLIDAAATNAKHPQPGLVSTMMWCTDGAPASMPIGDDPEDMGARTLGTAPPRNGTRFAVIDFPPGNHPHMHRTETVDYVIVIEGEIEMDMDASSVKLKAGDQTIWSYKGKAPNMYEVEHQELFAGIRSGKHRHDGDWMAQSTLVGIMARLAGYTGQEVSFQDALNDEDHYVPAKIAWDVAIPPRAVAVQGRNKLVKKA